jgi:transcriptional regulator with XRE-family HTH domain
MATKGEKRAARAIGAELRRLRKARGWSLRDLARETELDFGYVGKIERGADSTIETYRKLADALGLTLSALFAIVDGRIVRAPRRSRVEDSPHHPK